jgi:hypothetical protein
VGPRVREKILLPLPGIEPRSPGRPVRSHTLYCQSYPSSKKNNVTLYNARSVTVVIDSLLHQCYVCERNFVGEEYGVAS